MSQVPPQNGGRHDSPQGRPDPGRVDPQPAGAPPDSPHGPAGAPDQALGNAEARRDQLTPEQAAERKRKRRLKWEPPAAMIAVFLLGVWLVFSGRTLTPQEIRPDAYTLPLRVGAERGLIEVAASDAPGAQPGEISVRLLFRNGELVGPLSREEFADRFGVGVLESVELSDSNTLFKLFNITSWTGLLWVGLGFLGQAAFFGRMAVQWLISERERKSVVPPVFWYLSLGGGVLLFTYFVWRQDIVGVTGQTTGVVIYARNIRLIYKENRRSKRAGVGSPG